MKGILYHPNQKSTKYEHIIPQLIAVERNRNKGNAYYLEYSGEMLKQTAISEMILAFPNLLFL